MTTRAQAGHGSVLAPALVLALATTLALPQSGAAADGRHPECGDTRTIAGASDVVRTLAAGVQLRKWSSKVADVAIVSAEPGSSRIRTWTAPAGTVQLPSTTLALDTDALAAVNGDFFFHDGLGWNPASDVVVGGQAKYVVPGWTPSLAIDGRGGLRATEVRVTGTVRFAWVAKVKRSVVTIVNGHRVRKTVVVRVNGRRDVALSGMNSVGSVSDATAVLFTRTWPKTLSAPARVRMLRTAGTSTPAARVAPIATNPTPTRPWLLLGPDAARRLAGVPASAIATVTWSAVAKDGTAVRDSIGRGALLMRDGNVVANCAGEDRPRTAVGWDDDGHVWIMTAQGGTAAAATHGARFGGTTNFQMARWLHALGATDAVSLDGGGSTDLEVRTAAGVHRADLPDGTFARRVSNALMLVPRG